MDRRLASVLLLAVASVVGARAQCPWSDKLDDLHSSCTCSYVQSKLNVQCSAVNVSRLLDALRDGQEDGNSTSISTPIESLHVINSSVPILTDGSFDDLRVTTLHLAHCGLREIAAGALRTSHLEGGLLSLALPDNELNEDVLPRLARLRALNSLDLSRNRIRRLNDTAFEGLASLDTLNLMENHMNGSIESNAFRGLEATLKNLNLKGTGLKAVPTALTNMSALAFLDLSQNSIEDVGSSFFQSMHSLTALSLERNRLGELHADAFRGLEDTMSSLSLLNNGFKEMPTKAVVILKELRVLDLGFNRIHEISDDAFQNLTSLTLLALDGNPLVTLSFDALKHLHSTLRGLSIGGKSLVCDCHLRWIAEWVREYDLQVTSRERNPQFCGHPEAQRNKNLYLLRPAQLVCLETTTTTTTTETPTTTVTTTTITIPTTETPTTESTTTAVTIPRAKSLDIVNVTAVPRLPPDQPPLVRTPSNNNQRSARKEAPGQEIKIRDAFREDTNVVLTWELTRANVAGFRVIYRTFGDDHFKEGAVLPLRVRKFRMTNVPSSECCLIVCVVSLGEPTNLTLDSVPSSNCRELKTPEDETGVASSVAGQSGLDVLIIILVVAVGCTLIVAIIIGCACCCRRRRRRSRHDKPLPPPPPPIVELPPLDPSPIKPEWDQTSAYSSRSIPRARMYHMARSGGTVNSAYLPDDARSHLSMAKQQQQQHHGILDDGRIPHSMIDGQYGITGTSYEQYPASRSEMGRSSSKPVAMSMPVFHVSSNDNHTNTNNINNNNYRKKKNQLHQQQQQQQQQQRNGHHPATKWTTTPSHHGSVRSVNNGYAERETGYFDHPNPWSSPTDADHYNPNAGHVSQPFSKRDYT